MVLPGIQALFGFQLIAVFNTRFAEVLSAREQRLHYLAIALVTMSIGLIMAPAAFHRQTNPRQTSDAFLRLSSWLLLWSLAPLAVSLGIDVYLVGRVILGSKPWALVVAGAALMFLSTFWFALPRLYKLR